MTKKSKPETLPTDSNVLVIDVGNSEIKAYANGKLIRLITKYERTMGVKRRAMREVEYPYKGFAISGLESPYEGQWLVSNTKGSGSMAATGDKVDVYKPFTVGCCSGGNPDKPWNVLVSHWNPDRSNEIESLLKGVYNVVVCAREMEIEIRNAVYMEEGRGADYFARSQGSEGVNAIIDIGFNTLGFGLYEPGEDVKQGKQLAHGYVENSGVRVIVQQIIADPGIEDAVGYKPTQAQVIEAIKGDRKITAQGLLGGTFDLNPYIEFYSRSWLKETLGGIHRQYGKDLNGKNAAYWIVGGGAHLLRESVKGTAIRIPETPELANLNGMKVYADQLF